MARDFGQMLMQYFGTNLDVQYKDEKESDPVTNVDKEVQTDLVRAISEGYPGHGVVGEEDEDDEPAPDYVWVLDPLDGTKNFINGLPVFASSIGILHRGVPVAGAIYVPWPGSLDGLVVHARKCGGAYANDEPVTVLDGPEPEGNRLIALPASFSRAFRFGAPMRGKAGERKGQRQHRLRDGDDRQRRAPVQLLGSAVPVGRGRRRRADGGGRRLDNGRRAPPKPSAPGGARPAVVRSPLLLPGLERPGHPGPDETLAGPPHMRQSQGIPLRSPEPEPQGLEAPSQGLRQTLLQRPGYVAAGVDLGEERLVEGSLCALPQHAHLLLGQEFAKLVA